MDMQVDESELALERDEEPAARARLGWLRSRRGLFVVLVLLPTLLTLLYTSLIASPQYESRAAFIVRGMELERAPAGGLAELIGGGAGMSGAQREALSLRDYLLSLDAIAALDKRGVDVTAIYDRPGIDPLSALAFDDSRAEEVRDYYRDQVDVNYDSAEAITRIAVRAFSPEDAQRLAASLIELGEERINTFNERAIAAGQENALEDLAGAEAELASIQGELTSYRDLTGEIDPLAKSKAAQEELEKLEAELIVQRSELGSMRRSLSASSPLVQAALSRVSATERAVGELRAKLTGDSDALTRRLSVFEQLKLKQEFAAKRYDAARVQLEEAKAQAARQRLFLVPVVTANTPEKPVSPRPLRTTLTVFAALAVAFAIGWLVLAGVREHQAD